jgi:hypothetical protein
VKHWQGLSFFCGEQANRLDSCQAQGFQMVAALNKGMYYLKSSEQIFNRYDDEVIGNAGLEYLWRIFEALKNIQEVVKPFGYAMSQARGQNIRHLIYCLWTGQIRAQQAGLLRAIAFQGLGMA